MQFLVIDDDFGARGGMVQTLKDFYPVATIHQACSLADAIVELLKTPEMALVLLDLNLKDCKGMETLRVLKQWCEDAECNPRLVVVSAAADYDDNIVVEAIDNCATGFIAKGTSQEVFRSAIDLTLAGSIFVPEKYLAAKQSRAAPEAQNIQFTLRERQVSFLLIQGLSYKQIARRLEAQEPGRAMSEHTVRVHVQRMAWKLRAVDDSRTDGLSAKAAVLIAFAKRKSHFPSGE